MTTALVYAARAGVGGLGMQAATAVAGLSLGGPVVAARAGPGGGLAAGAIRADAPLGRSPAVSTFMVLHKSLAASDRDSLSSTTTFVLAAGRPARLDRLRPDRVYAFTQVGLESLEWAKARGVPTVLDNPNGHIENFARVYREETARWFGGRYHGHPNAAMIERVKREYEWADRIRRVLAMGEGVHDAVRCARRQDRRRPATGGPMPVSAAFRPSAGGRSAPSRVRRRP